MICAKYSIPINVRGGGVNNPAFVCCTKNILSLLHKIIWGSISRSEYTAFSMCNNNINNQNYKISKIGKTI